MAKILVLLGPTASGKTALAVKLADQLNGEIISVDSRQIYRGLDIGTGKDLKEYQLIDKNIPYHLIDILEIGEKFSVAHFQFRCYQAITDILQRGKLPILCGGTGLYFSAIIQQYAFSRRPDFLEKPLVYDFEFQLFGLNPALENRRKNCQIRLINRMEKEGLLEEVENLIKNGTSHEDLQWLGLEYKWLSNFLLGQIDYDRLMNGLTVAIQQFAKRQMTYFRKMEKDGIAIDWIPDNFDSNKKIQYILEKFDLNSK